jgi:type IV pilus assembly protein PilM
VYYFLSPVVSNRTLILECGTDRCSVGVFSTQGQRLCLHQFATEIFAPSEGADRDDRWLENIRASFRSMAKRTKTSGPAVLVLPPHLTLTKLIKTPRVEAEQREKIIRFEAGQNIPYSLDDVVWDRAVVSETATELEVLLATAKLDVLDPLCAAAHGAGFEPQAILPSSFATLAGFRFLQAGRQETFLGLNLGSRSTTLVLVETGRFALRTFALGLESIGTPATEGSRAAVEAVEPVRTKLLQEITRSLLHFQWRSGIGKPGHICITGSGAQLPGLLEALNAKMKVTADVCNLPAIIDFADETVGRAAAGHASTLLDLIGAAASQLRPNHAVVNLLPPRGRERLGYHKRRPRLIAAALLATGILIPPLIHFHGVSEEAQKKSAAIERELAPWRARDSRMRENLRHLDEMRQRIVAIEDLRGRRTTWLRLLAGLQVRLDDVEDVWLEKMQIAPAEEPGAPTKLLVSGCMLDRTHPLSKASPEIFARVKTLLARLTDAPFIAAIEAEHFDNRQPGILKFDFVLVSDTQRPL